jgi:hypothetical protein
MRALLIAALCGSLAACSQTTATVDAEGGHHTPRQARTAAAAHPSQTAAAAAADECDKAIQNQTNAAMLGGALGMAGAFGGFGGRGGAIAGQVASTAGGAIARSQSAQARANVMHQCQQRYAS